MIKRPPILPTILMLCGVSVLCTLGTWQIQRLEWKNDLIAQIDKSYADKKENPPILDLNNATPGTYEYGRVYGRIIKDTATLMANTRYKDDILSHQVVVALNVNGRPLWVDMGWSAHDDARAILNHPNNLNKRIWVDGLVWSPKWNSFTPDNQPQNDEWYKIDIAEISAAKDVSNPYPFILRAETASEKFDTGFEYHKKPDPNNNHLQYAFFWFTMAGVLIVIYTLRFLRQKSA